VTGFPTGGNFMEITEVRISLRDDAKLKAFASTGTFVAMPSRKRKDGEYQDIAHPINNSTRKWMEDIVLAKYEEEVAKLQTAGG
jgi:stage V sporulation protein G